MSQRHCKAKILQIVLAILFAEVISDLLVKLKQYSSLNIFKFKRI